MELRLRLDRIVKTDSRNVDEVDVKTIKYTLKTNAGGAKVQLVLSFEDQVPSEWKRILGSIIGDFTRLEIGPDAQQTTLSTPAEEEIRV